MKNLKRILVLTLVVAMLVSISACSLISTDEEKDAARVVATVNGVDILKQEVLNLLRQDGLANYGNEDYYFLEENAELLAEAKPQVLDYLIMQNVYLQKAATLGLDTFTVEELSDFETEINTYLDNYRQEAEATVLQQNLDGGLTMTEKEMDKEISALVDERLSLLNVTQDTFIDLIKEFEIRNRMYGYLTDDIAVTEEEVQDYYDLLLENQELAAEESAEIFEMMLMGSVQVYDLNETFYVKHILIELLEEDAALSEEARLLFVQAVTPAEQDAALVLLTPAFDKIMPTVEEVQGKIAAGEDFDALIETYGKDPGMAANPEGYPVVAGSGQFMPTFEDAAVALSEPGQVSEPIKTLFGYHILQLVSINPAGPIPYENVKAEIEYTLLSNAQTLKIQETETAWKEEATIARHDDVLMK